MKHRFTAKAVSWILALLLVLTALPGSLFQMKVRADGEEPTLTVETTNKNNDPLIVTATGGSWVGAYKSGEIPSASVKYFFRFDVDGEPHNAYNMTWGTRTESSFPTPFSLVIYLFEDEGYTILKQVSVHIDSVTEGSSSLSVDEEFEEGEPVPINAKSESRDAWVSVFQGTYSSSDTFTDKTPVEKFYLSRVENKGKTIEGLAAGNYTAVLFKYNKKVDLVANFTVKGAPLLTTDKDTYEVGEPIMVTTNYVGSGSWVGLYGKNDDPAAAGMSSYYWYNNNNTTQNLLEGTFNKTVYPGDYKVVLFGDSGYTNVVGQKEITLVSASNLSTDKTGYSLNEAIMVTAKTPYGGAWVGLYPYLLPDGTDVNLENDLLGYYYVTDETPVNLLETLEGELAVGHYKVILFTGGYDIDRDVNGGLLIRGFYVGAYDDENIVWNWTEDRAGYKATATFTSVDDENIKETVNATVEKKDVAPTCDKAGYTEYTATVTPRFATKTGKTTFSDVKIIEGDPATGHDWGEPTYTWGKPIVTKYKWEKTTLDELADNDVIAVTMLRDQMEHSGVTYEQTCYALSTKLTSNNNAPIGAPVTPEGNVLLTDNTEDYAWAIVEKTEGETGTTFALKAGDKFLYASKTGSKSVLLGDASTDHVLTIENNYLKHSKGYLGVYWANVAADWSIPATPDWRCYPNTTSNIKNQALTLWKFVGTEEIESEGYAVTATRTCVNDETHVETETVAATSEQTKAPTCTEPGTLLWTSAAFTNEAFTVQTKEEEIPTIDHEWGEWAHDENSDPSTHSRTCAVGLEKVTEACTFEDTLNADGTTTHTCPVCGYEYTSPVEGTLTTDKETYTMGDPIMVTATCTAPGSWVGLYKAADTIPTDKSFYWFYVDGNTHNILSETPNVDRTDFTAGDYKLVLFGGDYDIQVKTVLITIEEPAVQDLLTTDKDEYTVGEPVLVTANYVGGGSWVGLYGADETSYGESYAWFSTDGQTHNIVADGDGVKVNKTITPGEYKVVLFGDGGYTNVLAEKVITINPLEIESTLSTDKKYYKWGENIIIYATSPYPGAWVGLYPYLNPDGSEVVLEEYLTWDHVNNETGTIDLMPWMPYGEVLVINELTGATDLGKYKFILFTSGYDIDTDDIGLIIRSFNIMRTYDDENIVWTWAEDNSSATATFAPLDADGENKVFTATVTSEVVTPATCEAAGLTKYTATVKVKLVTVNGEVDASSGVPAEQTFTVVKEVATPAATGHEWGAWTHVEGSNPSSHERVCINDGSHKETEACTFEKTTNAEGKEVYKCTVCGYEQETNPNLSTDKTTYTLNEPIMVTANYESTDAWVGLYKKSDTNYHPGEGGVNSIYWYTVSEKSNPFNVLTGTPNAARIPDYGYGEFTVVLFGDGGYTNIVATTDITVASQSTIATDKQAYKWGDPILVTAYAPESITNAWVGVYPYDTSQEGDLDNKLIDWYYVNLGDNPNPLDLLTLEGVAYGTSLNVGKYKVILFTAGYDIDRGADGNLLIRSFDILRTYDDENIVWTWSEDKKSATATFTALDDENEKQTVTATVTEEVTTPATCEAAGVKTITATVTVEFETKTGTKTFTDTKTEAIPALGHAYGEWKHDEGSEPSTHSRTCANDPTHKETENCTFGDDNKCTVCGFEKAPEITGSLKTDKTTYEMGQPIMVEATCNGTDAWVGLYKKGDIYGDGAGAVKSIYWYYLKEQSNPVNILATRDENGRSGEFGPGEYTVRLFGSGLYAPVVAEVDITVTESSIVDSLTTDKDEYVFGEPIMVTATCVGSSAWVGLYKKGENPDPNGGGVASIYWFYLSEVTNPVNILETRDENDRAGDYGPGEFTLILFGNGNYDNIRKTKDIIVKGDVVESSKLFLKLNDVDQTEDYKENSYELGTAMSAIVTVEEGGTPGNAWLAYYEGRMAAGSNFKTPLEKFEVKDYLGKTIELSKISKEKKGDYTLVLFGDSSHSDIRRLVYIKTTAGVKEEVILEEPTCEKPGTKKIIYTDGSSEYVTIPALGHKYGEWTYDETKRQHVKVCANDKNHEHDLRENCDFEMVSEKDGVRTFKCKICGGTYTETYEVETSDVKRIYGTTRYKTSLKIADEMKKALGVEKFDNVILTTGEAFADALGGGYLAAVKKAPIILTKSTKKMTEAAAANKYIAANLKEGGTIYVLGGTTAVPEACLEGIDQKKFKVVRLAGKTRYDTNLLILGEAGVKDGDEVVVCTGTNFADSLAVSSSGKAILLVGKSLTKTQKAFLDGHKKSKLTILGGTLAVSEALEKELKTYGTVSRLSGSTRYATMALIAKTYYPKAEAAALVYAENFPDGLCAGPLANIQGMPLLLVKEGSEKQAMNFCKGLGIKKGYVLGGPTLIPDASAVKIFDLKDASEIK